MDAELKKLKKVTTFMRRQGILSYKTPELELQLAPEALFPAPIKSQSLSADSQELKDEVVSIEDSPVFNWSIPGLHPELEHA